MMLKVPYVQQYNDYACGAAVLEMVFKYYNVKNVSQEDIYEKNKELEPHGTGNFRITTQDLVDEAESRNFKAYFKQVNYFSKKESIETLKDFIEKNIPVIVCQQFTSAQNIIGHFRVVIGVDNKYVYVHDPHKDIGSEELKMSHREFVNLWQKTGDNVIGGIYIIIIK